MSDKTCERCGLHLAHNQYHNPFDCVSALKREVEHLTAANKRLTEEKLAAESEARETSWEIRKR